MAAGVLLVPHARRPSAAFLSRSNVIGDRPCLDPSFSPAPGAMGQALDLGGAVVIPRLRIFVLGTQGSGKGTEKPAPGAAPRRSRYLHRDNFGPRSATTQPEHAKSGR